VRETPPPTPKNFSYLMKINFFLEALDLIEKIQLIRNVSESFNNAVLQINEQFLNHYVI
jgi:hypothetical protein